MSLFIILTLLSPLASRFKGCSRKLSDIHYDLFTELEATYQMRKDAKRKKKFKKTPFKVETPSQLDNLPSSSLPDELPSLDLNTRLAQKSSSSKKKQRGVPKEKFRKKIM